MNILMMSNTYTPIVGGVEQSIQIFAEQFRRRGHRVVIAAPTFQHMPENELDVIRVPALQKFNRTDFSVNLPVPELLSGLLKGFRPDVIHSHHPFLMGDIALRLSGQYGIPLVFTYHTMFEQYLHYLPVHNDVVKRFVIELSAGYANLADQVIVPSESVCHVLLQRGVETPIEVIPTGIDLARFAEGDREKWRRHFNIPAGHFVAGYLGRVAPEKNMEFLARSVADFLKQDLTSHFLIVGNGPSEHEVRRIFENEGVISRVHFSGSLSGQELVDSYHAMDVFTFASVSETQGIVLAEAMAASLPVIAVDAPGVREIIKDSRNGRLLSRMDKDDFTQALKDFRNLPSDQHEAMKQSALRTAGSFSIDVSTEKMFKIYERISVKSSCLDERKHSMWRMAMKRMETEWELLKNIAEATQAAFGGPRHHSRHSRRLKLKRFFSRWEWSAKLLKLNRSVETEIHPGLVLIQIDGFSKTQFQKALAENEMPFLKSLLEKEQYLLHSMYPGMPTSTPAVQGELFYGVKQIVPAFEYFDQQSGRVYRMYDGDAVSDIESRLRERGAALLEGGSSYSNIYTGGAAEAHFCAASLGWDKIWREVHPIRTVLIALTHLKSTVRMIFLVAWEIVAASFDCLAGCLSGENLQKELKYVPTRVSVCVLLRELIELGVKIDINRGLPIIHLNLLGFDEQAHRRGPSSAFAHKSLKVIDGVIARIYAVALHSTRRHYDVWIYSDHGQEDAVTYPDRHKKSVQKVVAEIFKEFDPQSAASRDFYDSGVQHQRIRYLGSKFFERIFSRLNPKEPDPHPDRLIVTAIGPTGNIYLPRDLSLDEKGFFAERLVREARIPMVLYPESEDRVKVWTRRGIYHLPEDAAAVFGADHPFLAEVTKDFSDICRHPEAGQMTFCGWEPGEKPLTFPVESGAHAGPGFEESHAFALLPSDVIRLPSERQYLYISDLRESVLRLLNRLKPEAVAISHVQINAEQKIAAKTKLRVMTYNVHSCIGLDGKLSPERIARVIGRYEPDIVALQELEMTRARTGSIDQPHLIAKELEMRYHFHPSMRVEEEQYGNAILSRYPIELLHAGGLPGIFNRLGQEPRGALWVRLEVGGKKVQIINTHFGLIPAERRRQVEALMSEEWLNHSQCCSPLILCGDFNALPNSFVCQRLSQSLKDVQLELEHHQPLSTWSSQYPLGRIDHVFVSPPIKVIGVKVGESKLARSASDHLPLIVDLEL
jgi:endonuclease/exonuclease/phosphatase family metal-dependent hydrolase/glycosyltransferase involved in cell wall biosynthesis